MEANHSLNQNNMNTDSDPLPPSSSSSTSSSFSTVPSPPRSLLKRSRSLDSLSLSAHQQIQSLSFNSNPNQSTSPDSDSDSDSDEESAPKRTRKVSIDLDPATPQEDQEQEQEVAPKFDIQGIAQELNCGICLELVHRPSSELLEHDPLSLFLYHSIYLIIDSLLSLPSAVVPCLHSFCWHCIYSFTRPETPTKTSQNCPHCLQKITLVKPNSSLDSLKTLLLNFEPQRERPALEIMQANDEFQNWKVRSGSGEVSLADSRDIDRQRSTDKDGLRLERHPSRHNSSEMIKEIRLILDFDCQSDSSYETSEKTP